MMKAHRPVSNKEGNASKLFQMISRLMGGFEWLQVYTILVFLLLFPLWALYQGMDFGAFITSCLGLLLNWFILSGNGKWLNTRLYLLRFMYIEHSIILLITIYYIAKPLQGGWKKDLHHPFQKTVVKIFTPRPDMLLAWTEKGETFQWNLQEERWDAFSEVPLRFSGWAVAYDPLRDWMVFGLHDSDRLNVYQYQNSRWKGLLCPKGQVRDLVVQGEHLFALIHHRLHKRSTRISAWKTIRCGGYCSGIAGSRFGREPYLFATGQRWLESNDGGHRWRDITPSQEIFISGARAALGNQGTRYAYSGGFFQGHLLVAPPRQAFRRHPTPASDIRTLIVHPEDDQTIWIGTWGQGVYTSKDAGKTWAGLGLRGVEIRHLAYFQDALYAGSSNLVFNRGLYRLSLLSAPTHPSTLLRVAPRQTTPLTKSLRSDTLRSIGTPLPKGRP